MTPEIIPAEALLTSTQVGVLLQVNPSSVKKWVNDGHIVAFRTPGGHRRIRASDLVSFLDQHRIPIPPPLASAARRRMVIVDDDPAQLRGMGRALRRWADKVDVTYADNGVDALIAVGSTRPHALVIDVYMPGLDGIEVCRRLRANAATRDLTIIVTSGRVTPELEHAAHSVGVRRVLRKPVDVTAIVDELGLALALPAVSPPSPTG